MVSLAKPRDGAGTTRPNLGTVPSQRGQTSLRIVGRQPGPHRRVVGIRQVNNTGIDDIQSTHQHVVKLDERTDQPPPLRPGAYPALTRRTVSVGHGFSDPAKARVAL